ncbi:ABC transporter ATP-binding protein [Cognatishimia sp. WU-CL00825]|uniref:ABC transporter ATP-binding protein n=1 Tax=Cognatishimia sp. WU-CL00825 TaxID=3127658 RepID=UPI00310C65C5
MAVVEFENIHKTYGSFEAVKNFNLTVEDGEFCVFVGPSGCGKSTTLKMLAGLEPATSGSIRIGDRDVTDLGPGKRDIAMVFQNYALYPHMSVRKNIGFGLKMRGMSSAEINERVEEAAKILELTNYLDRRPKALSGGQRQRVALGRAIVREPSAFLMDEPLSNLDAKLRVQTRSEIVNLQKRIGTTTIYVTHDQTEALTMADKIVVMRDGVVQQIGTPHDLFHHPRNIFVAGFIGSPGMNFFRGPVKSADGKVTTTFAGHDVEIPQAAERLVGQEAIFGIRPEHIEIGGGRLPSKLTLVETLGTEKILHFDTPESQSLKSEEADFGPDDADRDVKSMLIRVIDDLEYAIDQSVSMGFPKEKIHVFDPNTYVALD